MKVLHIIAGLHNGGAEGVLYRIASSKGENTHRVISLMGLSVYGPRLRAEGISVDTLDMPRGRVTLKGLLKLRRLIQANRPDVIQTWMYHANLVGGVVARLCGKRPVFWCVRASNSYQFSSNSFKVLFWCSVKLSKVIPEKIIYSSHAGERFHCRLGYPDGKSKVICNGYDTANLRPDSEARLRKRREWGLDSEIIVIGMVARWHPLKDHETLFRALNKLRSHAARPWKCVLIGPGMTDDNVDLVAMIQRFDLADRVALLGSQNEILSVMNGLDIHVLSSKSEAFPNVIAEALSCGTPCVATNVGDVSAIIGDTGWVVPHSDPIALAEALALALSEMNQPETWQGRKEACRSRLVDRYQLAQMIEAFTLTWQNGIQTRANRRLRHL